MNQSNPLGRRAFFARAGALASVAGSLDALYAAQLPGRQPRNIIFMVADGMSPSVLPLAEHFSRLVRGKGLLWRALVERPESARGLMDMASLDSLVTDSSAASSSWGSGARIFNGMVNMLPDGTKLTPLADVARGRGKRVGLVTTATVTHATPAGFAAVERRRDDEERIAEQYIRNVDVIIGGGRKFFESAARSDGKDVVRLYRDAGYVYASVKDELTRAARSAKILGLFSGGHVPYTIDHRHDKTLLANVPSLAEMTETALASLVSGRQGFLLQVEGARVDHAAHNNDAAALLWDQIAFDDAIETVLRFAGKHPETLIVITSDHGNSNPGLNGMGTEYRDSTACFERLAGIKQSFQVLSPRLGGKAECTMNETPEMAARRKPPGEHVRALAREALGLDFTASEVEAVRAALAGQKNLSVSRQLDTTVGILGQAVGNHTGIGWTGTQHTSDYVLVTALGPGSERFRGHVRNSDVFGILSEFMGSKFRNPVMEPERARPFRESAFLRRDRPDWA
jgi:alkaline phosphatase